MFTVWVVANFNFLRRLPRSEHFHDMLSTMFGIADETLSLEIDHPVKKLERHLPDQDRQFIGNLTHINRASPDPESSIAPHGTSGAERFPPILEPVAYVTDAAPER